MDPSITIILWSSITSCTIRRLEMASVRVEVKASHVLLHNTEPAGCLPGSTRRRRGPVVIHLRSMANSAL